VYREAVAATIALGVHTPALAAALAAESRGGVHKDAGTQRAASAAPSSNGAQGLDEKGGVARESEDLFEGWKMICSRDGCNNDCGVNGDHVYEHCSRECALAALSAVRSRATQIHRASSYTEGNSYRL
jgi:hypothetical protein